MRPEERDAAYVWDMFQASAEIEEMLGDHDLSAFLENLVLVRAIERNLEIIGEAARRLSPGFREAHDEIPWAQVIGQRNIIAHEYGQIDHELLFRTVTEDLPTLASQLRRLLAEVE